MHLLHDKQLMPDMQFGSAPGCQATGTVLTKVLSHDHV
jgi:hypothetical protein